MEARNVNLSDMQVTAILLRELRENAGLSQRELAERLECQQPAIARLESGTIRPNLATLDRIAEALGFEFQHQIVSREQAFSTGVPVIPVRPSISKS
jgi:transcriptional regulator with XRE-family HTH domain